MLGEAGRWRRGGNGDLGELMGEYGIEVGIDCTDERYRDVVLWKFNYLIK